jgi:hypothetical protein
MTADEKRAELNDLKAERAAVAATRTREDVRDLAAAWLANARARASTAAGLVLNGHANPAEVQAVLAEFLLDSSAFAAWLGNRAEATAKIANRERRAHLKRLDAAILKADVAAREAAKTEALAAVEAQFAGDAA